MEALSKAEQRAKLAAERLARAKSTTAATPTDSPSPGEPPATRVNVQVCHWGGFDPHEILGVILTQTVHVLSLVSANFCTLGQPLPVCIPRELHGGILQM